jgi:glycosyltransferase involved in cell wall biosynthesis
MISTGSAQYVLITPARNEQAFIADVIEGVVGQTIKPARWVIVDDRSIDRTAEIIELYLPKNSFIRLLRIKGDGARHCGKKAAAFNAGLEVLGGIDYSYIGNLDADIKLPPAYYETILHKFATEPRLGLAGGTVNTKAGNRIVRLDAAPDSVPGAVQLFRKDCFESIGGRYLPLELGGLDAAAEIMARMNGWIVRQFQDVTAQEQRRMGTSDGTDSLTARYREGACFHALGYGTLFYLIRSLYKMKYWPWIIGSLAAVAGFLLARMKRVPIALPREVVTYLRREQRRKLASLLLLKPSLAPYYINPDRKQDLG